MCPQHDEQLAICLEKWKQFDKHIEESVPIRDTVWQLKMRVDMLEHKILQNAIIGGLIGALVGSGASPAIIHLVEVFIK